MHIKLKRTPGLYLAGFMGSGKTTVGRLLADRLGWDFVDMDAEIEAREQTTVGQIFEMRGDKDAEANQHGPYVAGDQSHYREHHGEALAIAHGFAGRLLPWIGDIFARVLSEPDTQQASGSERVCGN